MKKQIIFIAVSVALIFAMATTVFAAEIFISPSDYAFNNLKEMRNSYSEKVMQFTGEEHGANKYDLTFNIAEGGDYIMWARVYHESPDDNSLLYYDNGNEYIFDAYQPWGDSMFEQGEFFDPGEYYDNFYWLKVGERDDDGIPWNIDHVFKLKAGANTIMVANRENGFVIDMFILTTDKNYDPRNIRGNPKPENYAAPSVEETVADVTPPPAAETSPPIAAPAAAPQTSDNILLPFMLLFISASFVFMIIRKANTVR